MIINQSELDELTTKVHKMDDVRKARKDRDKERAELLKRLGRDHACGIKYNRSVR